jgi:hypothetical protein
MTPEDELKTHKKLIDISIKSGIDSLMVTGEITEADFYLNENGDKMINIADGAGDTIVFNYTQCTVFSYAGRMNQ